MDIIDDFNRIADLVEIYIQAGDSDLKKNLKEELIRELDSFKRLIENDKYTH